ncbi:MAG: glycosyltransferase [Clostridia bacterium]|nr:glycosyltransferase [Clostridia bacterium]
MEGILLSIIIPVFNTEKYLHECLDSVLSQPTEGVEVVCADDGSTDRSLQTLLQYTGEYQNVRALHQENRGVSAARNLGIGNAAGRYLWFVDSDDFIGAGCLPEIVDVLKRESPDLLRVKPLAFTDGEDTARYHLPDVPADESAGAYADWLWTTVLSKEIIDGHNIRFHEQISLAEDCLFGSMFKPYVKKESSLDRVAYFYRRRENSLSTTDTDKKIGSMIRTSAVFLEYAKAGKIGYDSGMYEACFFMSSVMASLAHRPHAESAARIKELKRQGLFPLSAPDGFEPAYPKPQNFDDRVLTRLKFRSFTRSGYLSLRIFRLYLKIKRRFFMNHDERC